MRLHECIRKYEGRFWGDCSNRKAPVSILAAAALLSLAHDLLMVETAMALREFIDSLGVRWRVWDVTPEGMHSLRHAQVYLRGFLAGWLVFEAEDGCERRRLAPIPAKWDDLSDRWLEHFLSRALPVTVRMTVEPESLGKGE
jgi:hypothetical protein